MWGRKSSAPQGRAGLAERRRRSRHRGLIALNILLGIISGVLVWGLQQSAVRIARVDVYSAGPSFAEYAKRAMQGSYFGIIPRDSIFFFPASGIRSTILAEHPDLAAVSIFRNGLTSISIKTNDRAPIARWCGLSPSGPDVDEYCYLFDASGVIFSAALATSTTINTFRLYAPLEGDTLEPLRATLANAEKLPATFDFARQLDTLGSPVTRVVLRGDEVDDYLVSGTRVTYVLAHEQEAFTALVSGRANFNLADGSIDYIDLRFDGKVYVKKVVGSRE
ncbi:hypothetical protein A3I46_01675 [Candidatus Kaiserbacteria bacterium RIFCSPLOWO2_02_FULL_54_13]|uniref:POTRA domain-containing protein n=1 Tax=Candidatus Kaiserbacteria bacterium RIFCSPHIGHO2_02_FULL_54_22 TaxID=1798495 RepID=A0A1F6DPE3_9BACT|nr:MAG: hypothetical protein UY91_C0014G0011 [Parcubacteria group bacterium GW2011_GWB1_55_9]OGG62892.1 MAG: hypothetical protein A3C19_02085 [Candidatus Kaiserbacteria bacterium RIFCSPHIGHO2_02_FULL_54_22]OGG68055.1 MAG: hypothetical protein A3E99_02140 [Candidatus Kaiserbacteria bacterium RIFCSPHIGHO2_12_FULL_54_16]OGG82535.1 MAG: hypothetical protein A3I46_01675 [Candidatus Kaiserbacteria bacterium RIFCSPLOWO2_02_FULL_54_13]OGG90556.1 MAG: hypothetical protein A3G12_01335 [Candidatus Kaiserb